jgi:hypothetical protein
MVKKQLKKAYNVDVKRLSKKMDLHDQPKAALKVGNGDKAFELWFRDGVDESVVIDKIADGKAAGTVKINKPICHLRTAAMLDGEFDLPAKPEEEEEDELDLGEDVTWPLKEGAVKQAAEEIVQKVADMTGNELDKLWEHLMNDAESFIAEYADRLDEESRRKLLAITRGVREEMEAEPPEEPEDFEEEFVAPTNKMALVDASVLEGLDNELSEQAIIIPVKHPGAVFTVMAEYDDTILRHLTITPAEIEQGGVDVVKTGGVGEGPERITMPEGIAPMSNDSSPERAIRQHTSLKQKHHMKHAEDVPGRVADPSKKAVVKRDQSKKDKRKKKRRSEKEERLSEGAREEKRNMIKTLLEDRRSPNEFDTENLVFARRVMHGLIESGKDNTQPGDAITRIDNTLQERSKDEATELLEHIEWLRENQKQLREMK